MLYARMLIFSVLVLFCSSHLSAESFDEYLKNEQAGTELMADEFAKYKKDIEKEFAQYKKIADEEFKKYKKSILQYWDTAEVTDKKKWVEYSPDYKTKRVVDFDKGYVEVNIITPPKKKKTVEKAFAKNLTDLLVEDTKTAFKRDRLSQNIEKRIKRISKNVKTSIVESVPVITKMITGTINLTKEEIKNAVLALRKKGKIEKKPSKIKGTEVVSLKIPLPPKSFLKKATEIKGIVKDYANKRRVDDSLVFAVIHTESAFNPMARSHVPAYGLMQIVPKSAGKDASELIYGKPVLLSPSYLYNSDNNINMGTTYLHILFHKYLKNIKNLESRLYCVISAYNTGAGNVAKAFTGKTNINKATAVINQMTPKEVYDTLLKKLPYDETKHYLQRVSKRMKAYRSL